ncbi:TolC family protein, partial [Klebsiella pneumoniae]
RAYCLKTQPATGETYPKSDLFNKAGPSLNLPLFDRGRRKATVVLRETDQQQAAVDFHKTVLKAWQEIDDALSRYAAAQQKLVEQE